MPNKKLKINNKPLYTAAASVYPYSKALELHFLVQPKFKEDEAVFLAKKQGDYLLVPRELAPVGEDRRSRGSPIKVKMKMPPRSEEQALIIENSTELLLSGKSHTLQGAVGFGKTFCAVNLIANIGVTTLVLVTKEDLMIQWKQNFLKYTDLKEDEIGMVQQNRCDYGTKIKVAIGMVHSVSSCEYPSDFYDHWGLIVADEAHRMSCNYFVATMFKLNSYVRLALSVGPDSIIELYGSVFGSGWVGTIENATNMIADFISVEEFKGYLIYRTDTLNIYSRGWTGTCFTWKPVKSFIKHICDRPCRAIKAGGDTLVITDDHSVFKLTSTSSEYLNSHKKFKQIADIVAVPSEELTTKDTLLYDDGGSWTTSNIEVPFNVIDFIQENIKDTSHIQVAVDTSKVTRAELDISPSLWWDCNNTGKHGTRLPFAIYNKYKDKLPTPTLIYTEGSAGRSVSPSLMLSDYAYLLGFYLGDGWVTGGRLSFAVEDALIAKFKERLTAIPDSFGSFSQRIMEGASVEFRLNNSLFAAIISKVFNNAKCYDKKIPSDFLLTWNTVARRELFQGLLDSDGHLSLKGTTSSYHYVTTSKELAKTFLVLGRSLGIRATITTRKPAKGGIIEGRQIVGTRISYQVHFSAHALEGNNKGHYGNREAFIHNGYSFTEAPISKISPIASPEFVYDLEMDGHPSFTANGILVHNTATPTRVDGKSYVFKSHLGEILSKAKNHIAPPKVIVVKSGWRIPKWKKRDPESGGFITMEIPHKPGRMASVVKAMGMDDARNHLIADLCLKAYSKDRKIVIFFEQINGHLKKMKPILVKMGIPAREITEYIGGLTDQQRVDNAKGRVILGSYTYFSEGTDIPDLDTAILASPRSNVMQAIGRILRVVEGKKEPVIFDIVDEYSEALVTMHHSRMRSYNELKANILRF